MNGQSGITKEAPGQVKTDRTGRRREKSINGRARRPHEASKINGGDVGRPSISSRDELANGSISGTEASALISLPKPRQHSHSAKYMNEVLGKYGVYRLFNHSGELLYVGASRDFKTRMHSHAGSKPWWHEIDEHQILVEWFDDMAEAGDRESYIILNESPKYNVHGKPGQTPSKYAPSAEYVSPTRGMSTEAALAYWRDFNSREPIPSNAQPG